MAKSAKTRALRVRNRKLSEAQAQRLAGPVEARLADRGREDHVSPTVLVVAASDALPADKPSERLHGFHIIATWLALIVFGYEKWPHIMDALTTLSTLEKYGLCIAAYLVGRPLVMGTKMAWMRWRERRKASE